MRTRFSGERNARNLKKRIACQSCCLAIRRHSIYNRQGFFVETEYNADSINNITADRNLDGSFTIHFGGDPKQPYYLPNMGGWNYIVRLYQPQ